MFTIWKFQLAPRCDIEMPVGAKILSVREQAGQVCLWALVDTEADKETRSFRVYGTGHEIPQFHGKYLGMAHLNGGMLVFHVFEI